MDYSESDSEAKQGKEVTSIILFEFSDRQEISWVQVGLPLRHNCGTNISVISANAVSELICFAPEAFAFTEQNAGDLNLLASSC